MSVNYCTIFADVDRAILRRMPATFHVGLPDERQRNSIFRRILGMERVHEDVDFSRLAKLTEGFSGSDIREACRTASVYRMREHGSSDQEDGTRCSKEPTGGDTTTKINSSLAESNSNPEQLTISCNSGDSKTEIHQDLRAINNDDLLKAVGKLRESKLHCGFTGPKFAGVGGLD